MNIFLYVIYIVPSFHSFLYASSVPPFSVPMYIERVAGNEMPSMPHSTSHPPHGNETGGRPTVNPRKRA